MGRRTKLRFDISDYTPYGLKQLDQSEVKKEYQRLRDVARKRLRRLEDAGLVDSNVYRYNYSRYDPASMLSPAELRYSLSALADFIISPATTVSGIRSHYDDMINTLNERGFTGINRTNISDFARFMEAYRASNLDKIYDSKRVAKIFSAQYGKGGKAGKGQIRASQRLFKAFREYMADQRA